MAKKKDRQATSGIAAASRAEIHEAAYFARKCGLTRDEALQMIREAHASPVLKRAESEKRKH
jgi:3-hydroxyisobutyrate dehydrogenase-like beta-hydroxyacid dehydrogenase